MLSFAQNLEDVVLHRLVGIVPTGTFIDVGAGHPVLENVTYALYCEGWRGINVEPMPREVALIIEQRPEDETVQAACGAAPGTLTLYEAPLENRGATTSDPDLVARYAESGQTFTAFDVEVVTLASLLDRREPGSVHIVKIDVEGMEREVIAGADLRRTRPWVLVIEATRPNTNHDTAGEWEPDVIAAGYEHALFDGLNRFYVRADLPEVRRLLSAPANVFDRWQRSAEARLQQEFDRASAEVTRLHTEVVRLTTELAGLHEQAREQHDELHRVHRDAAAAIAALDQRCAVAEEYARSLEAERDRLRGTV